MLEPELGRAAGVAFRTMLTTVQHVQRMVGFVGTAIGQTAREVSALIADYQELADELRRPAEKAGCLTPGTQAAQVLHFDPNRRSMQRHPTGSARRAIGTTP